VNIFDKTIAGLAQLDSGAKSQIVMCNMEKNAAGIYLNADPGGDLDRGDMQITACNLWHNDYGLLAHKFGGLMATGVKTMNSRLGSVRAEVLDEIATVRNWHLSACSLEGTQFTRTGMIATTTNLGNGKCRIVCTIAHGLAEDMQEIKLFDNSDAATRYIISNVDATSFEVVANFPTSTGGQWWTRADDLYLGVASGVNNAQINDWTIAGGDVNYAYFRNCYNVYCSAQMKHQIRVANNGEVDRLEFHGLQRGRRGSTYLNVMPSLGTTGWTRIGYSDGENNTGNSSGGMSITTPISGLPLVNNFPQVMEARFHQDEFALIRAGKKMLMTEAAAIRLGTSGVGVRMIDLPSYATDSAADSLPGGTLYRIGRDVRVR